MEQGAYADGGQESYAEVDDIQRFSQLVTKSGSDSDLTKDYTVQNGAFSLVFVHYLRN